jgi:plastocyanin
VIGVARRVRTVAVLLWLAALAGCARFDPAPREIVLVARGMTFVLASDPEAPNPVIPLRAGEHVRLVLRNEAPGLLHDFQIPAWKVRVDQIRAGQTSEVTFTVPSAAGRYQYLCRPHSEMMKGFVEVIS